MEYSTMIFTLLVLLLVWLFKRYMYEPSQYWKRIGIPYVSAFYFPIAIYRLFKNPIPDLLLENYRKHGRLYGAFNFLTPSLALAEPDFIRDILVKDFPYFVNRIKAPKVDPITDNMISVLEGDKWKRVRTILSPAFTTGKIKKMENIFIDCAKTAGKNFEEASAAGKCTDVRRLFGAFMMDVIASAAFGTKIDSHNDPDNAFVVEAKRGIAQTFSLRAVLTTMLSRYFKFLDFKGDLQKSMEFFKQVTLEIMKERKRTGQRQNDMLQLLMEAAEGEEKSIQQAVREHVDADCQNDHDGHDSKIQKDTPIYKGLNDDELLAQCVIFFIGGHETTASTLTFAAYKLAVYPECQDKLIAEVDEVLRHNGNKLSYEGIQEMKYLDNVVSETLRMFPPGLIVMRKAEADYTLKDTNITVKKGGLVSIPVYAMHYDPEFYPDPERFDPDRFTPEEKAKRNPYTYLPFGAGPRNCIAMRFALIIMKYCLAYLVSQFRFIRCEKTEVPLKFPKGQFLLATKEMNLTIEKRTDAVSIIQAE